MDSNNGQHCSIISICLGDVPRHKKRKRKKNNLSVFVHCLYLLISKKFIKRKVQRDETLMHGMYTRKSQNRKKKKKKKMKYR
jgi:hypothetical protein